MAIKYMTPVNIGHYDANKKDTIGWEYDSDNLTETGDGDTIIIPDNVKEISVTLLVIDGVSKIQTTTNLIADVIADNSIIWVDWNAGEVSETVQDSCPPVSALKMVNISGTTRLMIRAQ